MKKKKKTTLLASALLTFISAPVFAMGTGTTVNVPVTVTDPSGSVLQGKHVDATDNSKNVQVHAIRVKGASYLKWKVIGPVDSAHPATAAIQVRVGDDNAPEIKCPEVTLLSSDNKQLTAITFVLNTAQKSCTTTLTYGNSKK